MRHTCSAATKIALAATLAATSVPATALAGEDAAATEAEGISSLASPDAAADRAAAEAEEAAAAVALDAARDAVEELSAPAQAEKLAEGDLKTAESDMAAAKAGQAEAQEEADAAAAKSEQAAGALAAAQEAYDAAAENALGGEEQAAKGSLGFFESCGASEYAVSLLTYRLEKLGSPYKDHTRLGEEGDATSLSNMKLALERMAKVNDLRRAEGLSELKIIDSMMACSQVLGNYSSDVYEHMPYVDSANEDFPETTLGFGLSTNNYSATENLAWNYEDPFSGWYDFEKPLYEQGASWGQTGHYQNIVNPKHILYGCATAQGVQGLTDEQSFSEANYFGETEYTPAEYYERFMKYYDSVTNAAEAKAAAAEKLSAAQAAYDAAAKEQADAAAEVEAAKKAYDEAAGRKASAEKALEDARAAQAENAEALAAAQEKLAEAQAAYDDAHAAASTERAVYYAAYLLPDVDMSQYYADGAYYAAVNGLMSGYDDGWFGPNDTLTRGQLATILWRTQRPGAAAAYDAAAAQNATGMGDVEGGKYYTAAANWAVSAGVINGFEVDGHREFRPDEAVTMEQFACIMANLAGAAEGYDASGLDARYTDASSISTWAASSVAYGTDQGWFAGYENPDGTRELKPYEALSRGRAATMLMNMGVK